MAPGAKFSTMTSARFAMFLTSSSPRSDFRLTVMDFLLALNNRKYQESWSWPEAPCNREAARFAALRVFHLDDLGAEPGERLGAGRAGLELAQVQNTDAGKTAWKRAVGSHSSFLPAGARSASAETDLAHLTF